MPAPKISLRKIDDLQPDPRNARTHSADQIAQLVASIDRWGWTNPILADDLVRAGHGRLAAATEIYRSGRRIHMAPGKDRGGAQLPPDTVPVIDCSGWTEEERTAYGLADNQLALQAGWDETLLAEQIRELQGADFEIDLLGFDSDALDALLLPAAEEAAEDPTPLAPEEPVSQLGDCWQLGAHLIRCGSSTDPEAVAALLDGESPHLMVTDPPYGVEYDASWREESGLNRKGAATGKVLNDDKADWREAWALFGGDVAYVWHGGLHAHTVAESLTASGFELRSQIIWDKGQMVISRGDYHWEHEPCWYAVRKGRTGHYNGDRKQTTVWKIAKPSSSETGHSTQKPIECMERPIRNNSKRGDAIYEPFSGSGTTIIAAERTGRRCFAMELNPAYVDVAVARWAQLTGRDAVLVGDGRTFAEVARERVPEETDERQPAEA